MKLYTEEQVRKALFTYPHPESTSEELLKELTPIELPSDEEIEETFTFYPQMIEGAKWMRDKIKGGKK